MPALGSGGCMLVVVVVVRYLDNFVVGDPRTTDLDPLDRLFRRILLLDIWRIELVIPPLLPAEPFLL